MGSTDVTNHSSQSERFPTVLIFLDMQRTSSGVLKL